MNQKEQLKQLLSNTKALLEAMRHSASTASGEAANIGRYSSYGIFFRKYNELANKAARCCETQPCWTRSSLEHVKGTGDTTWPEEKEYFDQSIRMPPF